MTSVENFHILAHIFISFIGGILLWAIWYTIQKRFRTLLLEDSSLNRVDKGLAYLSSALFMWVLSGSWYLLEGKIAEPAYQIGTYLFSTANNLFLVLSLFHFQHAPRFIYNNLYNLKRFIGLILLLTVSSVLLIFLSGGQVLFGGLRISNLPDVLLSGFVSYLLLTSLLSAFNKRGIRVVGVIAALAVILMFISQLPEIFSFLNDIFLSNLVKIIAKTALIFIFLVLATIWVIQLANTPIPSEMSIHFQDWSLIKLNIPSKNILSQNIDFGSKTTQYKNLLKFAIRRKFGEGSEQCLVVGADGEMKSQTYLSRVIKNMNTILNLDEDHQLERTDIFTFIGQGKYRLRILPENIHIDAALLKEFTENPENQSYKSIAVSID